MTQQERENLIKKAYERFYNPELHHYSLSGYTDPEHYTEQEMYEMMQEIDLEFGQYRCRPKSLKVLDDYTNWVDSDYKKIHVTLKQNSIL